MIDSEIIEKMGLRGIPGDVTDEQITEAIRGAIAFVREQYPDELYGTFETVAGQQVYDLFGTGMPLAGGWRVLEMLGPFSGDSGDLDVFGIAPFLQNLGSVLGGAEWFTNPGDMAIYELNWISYVNRFGSVAFSPVTASKGASVRLTPTPQSARTMLVRYAKPRSEAEIWGTDEEWFLQLVEAFVAKVLARYYAAVAGTATGAHRDSGATMKFWNDEHTRLMKQAAALEPFYSNTATVSRNMRKTRQEIQEERWTNMVNRDWPAMGTAGTSTTFASSGRRTRLRAREPGWESRLQSGIASALVSRASSTPSIRKSMSGSP